MNNDVKKHQQFNIIYSKDHINNFETKQVIIAIMARSNYMQTLDQWRI